MKTSKKTTPVSPQLTPTSFPTFIKRPTFTPAPTISRSPTSWEKINISGVEVYNFYKTAKTINLQKDMLIIENDKFQIVYLPKFGKFLLSISSSPFPAVRREAEEEFLKVLKVDKKDACRLNVSVNTPYFANPDFAGKDFPLSFCPPQ